MTNSKLLNLTLLKNLGSFYLSSAYTGSTHAVFTVILIIGITVKTENGSEKFRCNDTF